MDLESEVNAEVGPVYKHHLHKFQVLLFNKLKVIFCVSKTTICSVFFPHPLFTVSFLKFKFTGELRFMSSSLECFINKQQNICSFFLSRLEFAVVPNMHTKKRAKIW